ncbi:MAG: hypothetical protein AB7V46_00320 [Thermomicrobiales bacterium]
MAKKKASGFVLAAAVREALEQDPNLKATDVIAAIKTKYPREKINEASAKVAFSNQRKNLGIGKSRRRKMRKPSGPGTAKQTRAIQLDILQAAKNLLAAAGSSDEAMAAIKQVGSLQLK